MAAIPKVIKAREEGSGTDWTSLMIRLEPDANVALIS
jgi:hypothetical protein